MKSNKSLLYFAAADIAFSVLASAMLFLGGKNEFQPEYGYFVNGSVFSVALYLAVCAGCVLGAVIWALCRKQRAPGRILPSLAAMPALSVLCAAAILAITVSDILFSGTETVDKFVIIRYISRILSVPAAAALLMSAFTGKKAPSALGCLLGFFTPLFFASKVLVDYFNHTTAVNSPVKILCQITYLSFMLLFTAEEGISLGRSKIYPRYLFTLFASAVLGISAGAGGLLLSVFGVSFPVSPEDSVLFLCTALYAAGRLFAACNGYALQGSDGFLATEESGTSSSTADKSSDKSVENGVENDSDNGADI